jgi:hypothetical protein
MSNKAPTTNHIDNDLDEETHHKSTNLGARLGFYQTPCQMWQKSAVLSFYPSLREGVYIFFLKSQTT